MSNQPENHWKIRGNDSQRRAYTARYNDRRILDVWSEFTNDTTSHGIPQVRKSSGGLKRLFWSFVLFGCLTLLTYNMVAVTMEYLKYKVDVDIQLVQSHRLVFPSVTVCNMNPIRQSAVNAIPELSSLLKGSESETQERQKRAVMEVSDCPNNLFDNQICYWLPDSQLRTHGEAHDACVAAGGALAIIDSSAKNDYITNDILNEVDTWFGLTRTSTTQWVWGYGLSPAVYTAWSYPIETLEWDCAYYSYYSTYFGSGYTWKNGICSLEKQTLCQVPPGAYQPVYTMAPGECDNPTVMDIPTLTEICFWDAGMATGDNAASICPNGQLAVIDSSAKNSRILDLLDLTKKYWFGLNRVADNTWVWYDGTPYSYSFWSMLVPKTNVAGKECAHYASSLNQMKWMNAILCSTTANVLCEKRATQIHIPVIVTTTASTTPPTLTTRYATTQASDATTSELSITGIASTSIVSTTGVSRIPTSATVAPITDTTSGPTTSELTTSGITSKPISTVEESATTTSSVLATEGLSSTPISTIEEPITDATSGPTTSEISTVEESSTTTSSMLATEGSTPISTIEEPITDATSGPTTFELTSGLTVTHSDTTPKPFVKITTISSTTLESADATPVSTSTANVKPHPPVTTSTPSPLKPPEEIPKEEFIKQERVLETLTAIPEDVKSKIGHQKSEFILDCQFGGYPCDVGKFDEFNDPVHGNCFIFNSGWRANETVAVSYRPGRRHGLKFVVNIQQQEYIDDLGESAGARVIILPQNTMPFPQDQGIMTKPGELSSIRINQIDINRLPYPYGTCTDSEKKNFDRNVFEEFFPVKYTTMACAKTCYQMHLVRTCSCADPQIPTSGVALGNKSHPACIMGSEKDKCRKHVENLYNENKLECDCPNPCIQKDYIKTVSKSMWPSTAHENIIKKLLISQDPSGTLHPRYNESEGLLSDFMKIEVYLENFNHEILTEKPAYPYEKFTSNIGGILGLWIGCSVVSLFEFVELFNDILVICGHKLFCGRKKQAGSRPGGIRMTPISETNGSATDQHNDGTAQQHPARKVRANEENVMKLANDHHSSTADKTSKRKSQQEAVEIHQDAQSPVVASKGVKNVTKQERKSTKDDKVATVNNQVDNISINKMWETESIEPAPPKKTMSKSEQPNKSRIKQKGLQSFERGLKILRKP